MKEARAILFIYTGNLRCKRKKKKLRQKVFSIYNLEHYSPESLINICWWAGSREPWAVSDSTFKLQQWWVSGLSLFIDHNSVHIFSDIFTMRGEQETQLKLYSYWRSSCSFRVRIALNLKGQLSFFLLNPNFPLSFR